MAIWDWRTGTFVLSGLLTLTPTLRTDDEEFRVYTEHPRLILTAQRLRLLKRERERESQRWRQFELLVKGGASLPEPGFALALYYAVSGDASAGKKAIDWALNLKSDDLRQLALVYDWCQPILSPQQSAALAARIRRLASQQSVDGFAPRDFVFAMIATADDSAHPEETALRTLIRDWWRGGFARSLVDGATAPALPDLYSLLEIMHAIRDNLKIDLREGAPDYFAHLPDILIAANYPAPYRAAENEFRIPMYNGSGEPDLVRAALARAAGLAMVAFDTNALQNQFLQGWLIQDRFLMNTPFGASYEFLWANPYQPGLSYYQLPLVFHDAHSGALFVRSAWDEDADWFGLYGGDAELFHNGRVGPVKPSEPLQLGDATIISARVLTSGSASTPVIPSLKFSMDSGTTLVIGLKPKQKYLIEVDDEEMRELATDRVGTLMLEYPPGRTAGVRVHE